MVLQNEHEGFWFYQNTVMVKYGTFDFLNLHQVFTSLVRTGILLQNNLEH